MNKIMGIDNPTVALLNIGAEKTKGRALEIETYEQLSNAPVNLLEIEAEYSKR